MYSKGGLLGYNKKRMPRRPKGYVGINHETIGSDILAVYQILKMPEQVLGQDEAQRLAAVNPEAWYPIEWLLDLMKSLDQHVGHYGLMQIGRTLFKLSHQERVIQVAKCARDIIYGIDGMYHHANRGRQIGGWRVLKFELGDAELEKTTPHHCSDRAGHSSQRHYPCRGMPGDCRATPMLPPRRGSLHLYGHVVIRRCALGGMRTRTNLW